MFNRYINSIKQNYKHLLVGLCGFGLCCPCLADVFDNFNAHIEITPIRFMDNQALFETAQLRREGRICNERLLMNSRWLLQDDHNTWSGSGAIRKLLQSSFSYVWNAGKESRTVSSIAINANADASEGWLWPNYGVSVSEDEAHLKVKLNF